MAEGLPVRRSGKTKAWLSIMYGCIQLLHLLRRALRPREGALAPLADVVAEARELVEAGYKDITLLGQNVNSYGKDLDEGRDFADLIRAVNDIPGDFLIRFMTSPPARRHGKALPHDGRVRKVRKAHPPARAERLRPRPARDEPAL